MAFGGGMVEAAGELVGEEVAGEGDEKGVGFGVVGGGESGFEQGPGGVEGAAAAGGLESLEVCRLGGERGGR